MTDRYKFERAFDLCDDTRSHEFIWRCQFRTLLALMGYYIQHDILNGVLYGCSASIGIGKIPAWNLVQEYHRRLRSQFGAAHVKRVDTVDHLFYDDKPNVVAIRNGYGVRRFDYQEYVVFTEYHARLDKLCANRMHSNPYCHCKGNKEKETVVEEKFEHTSFDLGYLH